MPHGVNGNTQDFDSCIPGSNPGGVAKSDGIDNG